MRPGLIFAANWKMHLAAGRGARISARAFLRADSGRSRARRSGSSRRRCRWSRSPQALAGRADIRSARRTSTGSRRAPLPVRPRSVAWQPGQGHGALVGPFGAAPRLRRNRRGNGRKKRPRAAGGRAGAPALRRRKAGGARSGRDRARWCCASSEPGSPELPPADLARVVHRVRAGLGHRHRPERHAGRCGAGARAHPGGAHGAGAPGTGCPSSTAAA